jgi:hypothetical protein
MTTRENLGERLVGDINKKAQSMTFEEREKADLTTREIASHLSLDPPDLAQIIGGGISVCMRDRNALKGIEQQIDEWLRQRSADKPTRVAQINEARKQLETARQALEALYSRFRSQASTYKN